MDNINRRIDGTTLDERKLMTMIAALMYWQREGVGSSGHEQDLATGHGRFDPLTREEIDKLCHELEFGFVISPTVVVHMDGAEISFVNANEPVRVIMIDVDIFDIDDPDNRVVNGAKVIARSFTLDEPCEDLASPLTHGLAPDFVHQIAAQVMPDENY